MPIVLESSGVQTSNSPDRIPATEKSKSPAKSRKRGTKKQSPLQMTQLLSEINQKVKKHVKVRERKSMNHSPTGKTRL